FSRGVSSETRSVYFKKNGQAKRMRSYYVMQQFVNGISGHGMYYIPCSGIGTTPKIYTMAFSNDKDLFIVLVSKDNMAKQKVSLVFPKDVSIETVKRCVFEKSLPIQGIKDEIKRTDASVVFELPAESITFLSFKL
ncbi:MAG: hypothetical protein WCR36_11060, partial [Bacteroidaceae bacterium]